MFPAVAIKTYRTPYALRAEELRELSTRAFFEYFALSDTRRELWDTHHRTLMGDSAISVALKTLDLQTERLLSTLEAYVSVAATLLRHKMLHPAKKGTSFAIRPVEHAAQLVTRDLERALDLVLANLREVLGRATKTVKALKDMTEQVAKERVEGKLTTARSAKLRHIVQIRIDRSFPQGRSILLTCLR